MIRGPDGVDGNEGVPGAQMSRSLRHRCERYGRGPEARRMKEMATSKKATNTNSEIFERQARICKAFAHPGRLELLDLLGQGERGASELQQALGISKTRMSQHVSILKSAGVLATRRQGKQMYCSLAMPEVKQACQLIRKVLQGQIAASNHLVA